MSSSYPTVLQAQGTTLGADNGIGVAAALALLDLPASAKLPPLECLFTIDEETGLTGKRFQPFALQCYLLQQSHGTPHSDGLTGIGWLSASSTVYALITLSAVSTDIRGSRIKHHLCLDSYCLS